MKQITILKRPSEQDIYPKLFTACKNNEIQEFQLLLEELHRIGVTTPLNEIIGPENNTLFYIAFTNESSQILDSLILSPQFLKIDALSYEQIYESKNAALLLSIYKSFLNKSHTDANEFLWLLLKAGTLTEDLLKLFQEENAHVTKTKTLKSILKTSKKVSFFPLDRITIFNNIDEEEILEAPQNESMYLLHTLCFNNNEDALRLALLVNTSQINSQISGNIAAQNSTFVEGDTALHVAVRQGYLNIVRLLLEQPEIDASQENAVNMSSLELAFSLNNWEIFNLLILAPKVTINIFSLENKTVLNWLNAIDSVELYFDQNYLQALYNAMYKNAMDEVVILLRKCNKDSIPPQESRLFFKPLFIQILTEIIEGNSELVTLDILAEINSMLFKAQVIEQEEYEEIINLLAKKTSSLNQILEIEESLSPLPSIHAIFEENDLTTATEHFQLLQYKMATQRLTPDALYKHLSEKTPEKNNPLHIIFKLENFALYELYINYIQSMLQEKSQTLLAFILWDKNNEGKSAVQMESTSNMDSAERIQIKNDINTLRRKYQ